MSAQLHKNEVHIAGLLAKDPIVRNTATGKKVATVTVTTTHKEKTEYHRVVCWEALANKVGELRKGDFVQLVGHLQTRSWEDASKIKHYSTEIIAWQFVVPGKEEVTGRQGERNDLTSVPIGTNVDDVVTGRFNGSFVPIGTDENPAREQKVGMVRPVTLTDPITDADVPW